MIPKPLTLRKDDYKEAPEWAERFFTQLNEWLGVTTQALTRALVRAENMRSTVKTITFTTKTPASATFPLAVKHDLGQSPTDVWVSALRPATIATAWSFTWSVNSADELSVRFQGLADATAYEARIIIE